MSLMPESYDKTGECPPCAEGQLLQLAPKNNLIWDKTNECMPREERQILQTKRLKDVAARCYNNVPFYRQKFDELGIKPEDIKSLDDLSKLPFTVKTDLRDNYPFGLFAVPLEDVVRIHASSGTTGKPIVGGYTRNDLNIWAEVMARTLTAGGLTAKDVSHIAYGYGLFTGGLGFHYGSERIGASTVPVASGLSQRQIMLWQDFGATALMCTPSYALSLAETAAELGVNIKEQVKLRVGFFGAEPWTDEMRREIEEKLNLEAYDIFGLTEIIGPGVAVECCCHDGLHIQEDHFLPEIIDPETGRTLPYGEKGELVFTSLTKEAFPVIRYRTRDITVLDASPCACGRTTVRMKKVTGRSDDMLIIRGVNVFPSQIESVLLKQEGLIGQYQIIVNRIKNLDTMEVQVEATEELYGAGPEAIQRKEQEVMKELSQTLALGAKVTVVPPKSITRSEGKAKRVIDNRNVGF